MFSTFQFYPVLCMFSDSIFSPLIYPGFSVLIEQLSHEQPVTLP
jgi:hypothetical protein